ncbi:uncharacterized protein LOC135434591 [Drosophila montana]|uniref:uncharacterized protein LOC135434591 n=1 Tax=Drosophila montana TaxID=40370 RepID=UPI00313F0EDF
MDWLILTSYFLWFFSPLSNPVVHIWLRLRGPQYSIHIAVPDVFEPPDIEQIVPTDFVERPVQKYLNPYGDEFEQHLGNGGNMDSMHTTQAQQAERQGRKKSPLFWIQLSKSFSIVAYDNPRTVYLHYERIFEGVNRVTWVNLNLASQLLWLVYLLCLAAGVVEMFAYMLCAGSVKFLKWLPSTIMGLCSSPQVEGSLRQLLPQTAHLEAVAMFRALLEIYAPVLNQPETPVDAPSLAGESENNETSGESDIVSKIQQTDSARSSESGAKSARFSDAPQQYVEKPDLDQENRPEDMSYETLVEMMEFEFQLRNLFGDERPFGPASEQHAPITDLNIQEVNEAFPETQDSDLKLEIQLEFSKAQQVVLIKSEESFYIEKNDEEPFQIVETEQRNRDSNIKSLTQLDFPEAPPKNNPFESKEAFNIEENDQILPVRTADLLPIPDAAEEPLKVDDAEQGNDVRVGGSEIQTQSNDFMSVSDSSELSINMQESEELSIFEDSENFASYIDGSETSSDKHDILATKPGDVPFKPLEIFHIEDNETFPDSVEKSFQIVEPELGDEKQVAMRIGSRKPSNNQDPDAQAQFDYISIPELLESEELSIIEETDKEAESECFISIVDGSETSAEIQDIAYNFTESLKDIRFTKETFFMDQNDDLLPVQSADSEPTSDPAEEPIRIEETEQVNRDDIKDSTEAFADVVPSKSEGNDDTWQEQFANLLKISNEDSFKAHKTAQEDDNWVSAVVRSNPLGSKKPLKVQELEPAQARTDDFAGFEETVSQVEANLSMVQGIDKEAMSDDLISFVDCSDTSSDTDENNFKLETRLANKILIGEAPQPDDTIGSEVQKAEVPSQTQQISEEILKLPETYAESELSMTTSEWSDLDIDIEEILATPPPPLCFPNAPQPELPIGFYEQVDSNATTDSIAGAQQPDDSISSNIPDVEFSSATDLFLTEATQQLHMTDAPQPYRSISAVKLRSSFPRDQQPAVSIWPGMEFGAANPGTGPPVPIWANVPEVELSSASSMSLTESLQPASSISDVEFRSVTQLSSPGPDLPLEPYSSTFKPVVDSRSAALSADLSSDIPDVELFSAGRLCQISFGESAEQRSGRRNNCSKVDRQSFQHTRRRISFGHSAVQPWDLRQIGFF